MKVRAQVAVGIALAGMFICLVALSRFVSVLLHNRLPWSSDRTVREHYLAVGASYAQGFAVGFFLCLSLAVAAVGIVAWRQHRDRSSGKLLRPDALPGS